MCKIACDFHMFIFFSLVKAGKDWRMFGVEICSRARHKSEASVEKSVT